MKATDKHFMTLVDLIQAKESIEYAIARFESGDADLAVSNIRLSICKLADALEAAYRVKR